MYVELFSEIVSDLLPIARTWNRTRIRNLELRMRVQVPGGQLITDPLDPEP